MKLTKFEHACVVLDDGTRKLVIDPGDFCKGREFGEGIDAIVVTHEHGDHFSPDNLATIYQNNPQSYLLALDTITSKMPDHEAKPVTAGDAVEIGPYRLRFFGGQHEQIHPDYPAIGNLGVLINDSIYYPGDSFVLPDTPVDILLVPAAAPWMKTAEAMDFVMAIKPRIVIPTHDAVLSEAGAGFTDNWIRQATEKVGGAYHRLPVGESIEL